MFTSPRRALALAASASALLVWLSGCGSTGSHPAASASPPHTAASSGAARDWKQALGTGVTVLPPASTAPGHGSPGAVVQGAFDAFKAKNYAAICPFYTPSFQRGCQIAFAQMPASAHPYAKGFALGYVAINGSKALVGWTGSICQPGQIPACVPNHDPAALLSSGSSFATLWAQAVAALNSFSSRAYALQPCVKAGNSWYKYPPSF